MGYSTVNISEIEGTGPGGAVHFVRRVLGVEAFGVIGIGARRGSYEARGPF